MVKLSRQILASIFGDVDQFCGKEDVIHAIIYYHLLNSGLSLTQVAREQSLSKGRLDIVVFNKKVNGLFQNTDLIPELAIEVKGGAYGNRNALRDEITSDGYCNDMEKLETAVNKGIDSWFICVDMAELGRAIDPASIKNIQAQCKDRNISFAYFCQGEDRFFYAPFDKDASNISINTVPAAKKSKSIKEVLTTSNPAFSSMCEQLLNVNGHEANTTAALYKLFRDSGFSVRQLSLETYFSFAKKPGSTMQDRPDLVLFNQKFDGRFNLYKNGDRKQSNDAHKMKYIDSIFEVKGSASINKKGCKAREKIYLDDIRKLKNWQAMANDNGCKNLDAWFVCLDTHKTPLPQSALQDMFELSGSNKVVYISHNGIELSF